LTPRAARQGPTPPRPHSQGHPLRSQAGPGCASSLDPDRFEIDTNAVERAIRPIAVNCKNPLFAGSDQGGVDGSVIASLIETCKLKIWMPLQLTSDAAYGIPWHATTERVD
jgi:hypothetical protein